MCAYFFVNSLEIHSQQNNESFHNSPSKVVSLGVLLLAQLEKKAYTKAWKGTKETTVLFYFQPENMQKKIT